MRTQKSGGWHEDDTERAVSFVERWLHSPQVRPEPMTTTQSGKHPYLLKADHLPVPLRRKSKRIGWGPSSVKVILFQWVEQTEYDAALALQIQMREIELHDWKSDTRLCVHLTVHLPDFLDEPADRIWYHVKHALDIHPEQVWQVRIERRSTEDGEAWVDLDIWEAR